MWNGKNNRLAGRGGALGFGAMEKGSNRLFDLPGAELTGKGGSLQTGNSI